MNNILVIIFLGFASLVFSSPPPVDPNLERIARELWTTKVIFDTPMADFVKLRDAKAGPQGLTWEADGCTNADDSPFGWNFKNSCNRHDFGYRNYKLQGRFTKQDRKKIDKNFKNDMFNQCAHENGSKDACRTMAKMYYRSVRMFGASVATQMLNVATTGLEEMDQKALAKLDAELDAELEE
ncbi:secretory phospholipase-like protein A2 [Pyrenochaeta sp. MPI-SDFR-AT-0127]|nr:secretory phospholipase-like protein A2 [Pyrenochaeta sp. MPI-SDFR-AT-0127]